jgi:hypothetical protein
MTCAIERDETARVVSGSVGSEQVPDAPQVPDTFFPDRRYEEHRRDKTNAGLRHGAGNSQ